MVALLIRDYDTPKNAVYFISSIDKSVEWHERFIEIRFDAMFFLFFFGGVDNYYHRQKSTTVTALSLQVGTQSSFYAPVIFDIYFLLLNVEKNNSSVATLLRMFAIFLVSKISNGQRMLNFFQVLSLLQLHFIITSSTWVHFNKWRSAKTSKILLSFSEINVNILR